ncbi:MAG: nuclear transport factor 2 family protein [Pyrinomonadaceae bacterium]|nr:nuclear transport factor 2 family protein [Pyrinomonadaceae bacterium]
MKQILASALLVMAASSYAFGQCSEAEKTKLQTWDGALGDPTRSGDRAFLQAAYADDYVGMMPWGTINKTVTLDNAVRAAERNKSNPAGAPAVKFDYYDITCTPTTAVVAHRNVSTTKRDGKEETSYSRSVHVLEKRGGNWVLVSNAGSPLDDAGAILYMEREWNDADMRRDAAWFERNFASDYNGISSRTGVRTNRAQDIEEVKGGKIKTQSAELSNMSVRVEGNTAVVLGVNHVKGTDDKGQPFDRRVSFTDTFIKRDGRWQVWTSQGTLMQPEGAMVSAAKPQPQ